MRPWTRRRFLRALARAATAAAVAPLAACAGGRRFLPPPDDGSRVLADLHLHAGMGAWLATTPLGLQSPALLNLSEREFNATEARWEDLHAAGIDLVCVAHFNVFDEWLSMPLDPSPQAPVHTHRMLDVLEDHLRGRDGAYAAVVRTPQEMERRLRIRAGDPRYRVAVVHSLEGAHAFGGELAAIEPLARRGVAYVTLTHFFHKGLSSAPNSFPFFPDAGAPWSPFGLSGAGREFVAELQRCGVIVDATHLTDHAMADLLACSRRPLLASHAAARALGEHPYSFHDEQIQGLVEGGGLFGAILYPFVLSNYVDADQAEAHGSLDDTVRTLAHVLKITGREDALALGSDFGGYIMGPEEISSVGEVQVLRRRLEEEFGPRLARAILYDNAVAFLRRNWGVGA